MGLLSRITDWSRPAADLLIVADIDSTLASQIAEQLSACDLNHERACSYTKSNRHCVHFLEAESFLRTSAKKLSTTNQLMLNVCHRDLENETLIDRLHTIDNLAIFADNSATSSKLQSCGVEADAVFAEGIWPEHFEPAGINRRLAARRSLKIPHDAQCVGVFEPLSVEDQDFLAQVAAEIDRQAGPVCLVMLGPKSKLDRSLRNDGISVLRANPRTRGELLACYWSLDMYLNISEVGDMRGVLRSWAADVAVVSRPNTVADDILRDGLTAAVAEFNDAQSVADAAVELCRDDDFRHGCCERGLDEVHAYAWPNIAERYAKRYSEKLEQLTVTHSVPST